MVGGYGGGVWYGMIVRGGECVVWCRAVVRGGDGSDGSG